MSVRIRQRFDPLRDRQGGAAMVEFALFLPLLLLLLLGTVEFGRAFYQYNTLSKAVRDGARYYASNGLVGGSLVPSGAAQTATVNLVRYGNTAGSGAALLPNSLPSVTTSVSSAGGDPYVTVAGTYSFQLLPGDPLTGILTLFGSSLSNSLTLSATVTMRAL